MKFRAAKVAVLGLVLAGTGLAPSAHAANEIAQFDCVATLNLPAGSGTTHCVGTISSPNAPTDPRLNGVLDVTANYNEANCPTQGTATGTVEVDGVFVADFEYSRNGAVANIELSVGGNPLGTAVAIFGLDNPADATCTNTSTGISIHGVAHIN